ncbi:hypothetical protein, partial [Klebsiella pneumoniae]|uniref:hypothetical protein n=1 Tax=Klebsiella pneumoniae TaxID=573 RepID=UPI001BB2CCBB
LRASKKSAVQHCLKKNVATIQLSLLDERLTAPAKTFGTRFAVQGAMQRAGRDGNTLCTRRLS